MINESTVKPLPDIFCGKDLITNRINNYKNQKHPLLNQQLSTNGVARQDTRSIWYTRQHVETWLDEMNYYNADGMRVYFGAYGEGEEGRPPGQLCLLFVLTRATANGGHKDIILEQEPDFEMRLQSVQNLAHEEDSFGVAFRPNEYNYGAPCPPVCDNDDDGDDPPTP
jgi:hypothetical protein